MAKSIDGNLTNWPSPDAGNQKSGGTLNPKMSPASGGADGNQDTRPAPEGTKVANLGQSSIRPVTGKEKRLK